MGVINTSLSHYMHPSTANEAWYWPGLEHSRTGTQIESYIIWGNIQIFTQIENGIIKINIQIFTQIESYNINQIFHIFKKKVGASHFNDYSFILLLTNRRTYWYVGVFTMVTKPKVFVKSFVSIFS